MSEQSAEYGGVHAGGCNDQCGASGHWLEPEPTACRTCGKSATACGKSRTYCCSDCSASRFDTHYPATPIENLRARVQALADQWNETPDYAPHDYDRGRVEQRHDMTEQLLTVLTDPRTRPGLPTPPEDRTEAGS